MSRTPVTAAVLILSFGAAGLEGQDVAESVRAAITPGALEQHTRAIVAHKRPSGSPGENAAIDYIAATLREAGVDVTVHEFTAYTSNPISATVDVVGHDLSPEAITLSFSASASRLRAPVVDVGSLRDLPPLESGTGERLALPFDYVSSLPDLAGAIALVEGQPRNLPIIVLTQLGAVGAIFVNPEERLNELIVTSTWGTPSLRSAHRLPTIPVAQIRKSGGEAIRSFLSDGPVEVEVTTVVDQGWKTLRLPVARIMPDTDAPYVLLGGHIDGWHYGATDEGASNAAMMELAIAFHRQRARLRRGLVVAWWPGHSNARYGGSTWFADRFFTELRDRGVAYLNIDGVGQMNAKRFSASGTVSLEAFAQRIVSNRVGEDINVNRPGRNSDQAFNGIGLPLMQFNHTRLAEDGGYWWWHTEDDTFDKVDMSILETDAEIYGDALTALLTGALPLDVPAQTGALVAELERRNGQADGRFDLSEAVNLAQRLHDMVATYYGSGFNTAAPNLHTEQALIRFLRPLHRIMYSPLDPYHPDPGTNLGMLPGLAPVSILSEESPQSDRYRFAIATLIRERNRVLDAIDQSIQVFATISNPTGGE